MSSTLKALPTRRALKRTRSHATCGPCPICTSFAKWHPTCTPTTSCRSFSNQSQDGHWWGYGTEIPSSLSHGRGPWLADGQGIVPRKAGLRLAKRGRRLRYRISRVAILPIRQASTLPIKQISTYTNGGTRFDQTSELGGLEPLPVKESTMNSSCLVRRDCPEATERLVGHKLSIQCRQCIPGPRSGVVRLSSTWEVEREAQRCPL